MFTTSLFLIGILSTHTFAVLSLVDNAANNYFLARIGASKVFDLSTDLIMNGTCLIPLTAGATIGVVLTISNGTKVVDINGAALTNLVSFFSGYLLK